MKFKSELSKIITPVIMDNGKYFINELFNKKFNCDAPEATNPQIVELFSIKGAPVVINHLIGFYKNKNNSFQPVSYVSLLVYKNVILVGGVMTDGEVIRKMSEHERQIIANSEGIYYSMLEYVFEHFADQCDAYFGYVNNARALEVNLSAGFKKTEFQYLIANFHKPLSNWKKNKITKMIRDIGPF